MSLSAGSVTVDNAGIATGSGLAKALYDADVATFDFPALPVLDSTDPPYSTARPATQDDIDAFEEAIVVAKQEIARRANAYASGWTTYFLANAHAVVTTESLGKTPNPNTADTPIEPPDAPVAIPIE